jgi:hypothetical protein
VPAVEAGTAFVPWVGGSLADILCVQEERVVANDNTVRVSGAASADPARSPPLPLREGHRAGPRVSGWHVGGVPWPAVLGALSARMGS